MPKPPLPDISTASTIPSGGIPRSTTSARCSSSETPPNEQPALHFTEASPNLFTGALGRSSSRAGVKADLERVYALFPRLLEKRRTRSGLTSGGEQQMTAIGRGLMSRPKLFVLDEPSMGLAPLIVDEIFSALRRLNRDEGLSILVAEQNSAIALKYADRATVLENGVSVLEGSAADLRQRDDIKSYYLGGAPLPPQHFPQETAA
ncbi:hypothetical protein LGH82_12910 [Mesorhizobium sp. PAMC28654]|uniref:ABC transporter ATP-binding protein n=1 Tax=Mesorhizobium sp. PAMC28654 TaxID=2880934 RepID=UPI001D0BD889|nr:ATP-binding cassette domain-containing protein [Mesorhizobium sp. PAMC28654]UDL92050.1 hypothetical protein LGH82_12910 [Mesorhizobium sp. PAMC28654]